MVWDWLVLRDGVNAFFVEPSGCLLFCVLLFSLPLHFLYGLTLCDWGILPFLYGLALCGWGIQTDRVDPLSPSLAMPTF